LGKKKKPPEVQVGKKWRRHTALKREGGFRPARISGKSELEGLGPSPLLYAGKSERSNHESMLVQAGKNEEK